MYDRFGNLLNTYKNARKLSKDKGILTQTIYDICDGKFAYNKEYVFRYSGDPFNLFYTFKYFKKHINIYNKEDIFLKQCFNIKDCINYLRLNTSKGSSIQKCLNHKRQFAYGYKFYRIDDISQPDKTKIITENDYIEIFKEDSWFEI